jgi:hypothetical protein
MAIFGTKLTWAARRSKPSWFIVATQDNAIAPELMRKQATNRRRDRGSRSQPCSLPHQTEGSGGSNRESREQLHEEGGLTTRREKGGNPEDSHVHVSGCGDRDIGKAGVTSLLGGRVSRSFTVRCPFEESIQGGAERLAPRSQRVFHFGWHLGIHLAVNDAVAFQLPQLLG